MEKNECMCMLTVFFTLSVCESLFLCLHLCVSSSTLSILRVSQPPQRMCVSNSKIFPASSTRVCV